MGSLNSKAIAQSIQKETKNWNIDAMVQAIIEDDPTMMEYGAELHQALMEVKKGDLNKARSIQIPVSPITDTRLKMQLSQIKFAERLGISVATLRSWEQGIRKPSGAAKTLLDLLTRHPELIEELQA